MFSFAQIREPIFGRVRRSLVTRTDIVFLGLMFLALFFSALLVADAYLFYVSNFRASVPYGASYQPAGLNEREIDEIVRILDGRSTKLEALLSGSEIQ